MVSPASDCLFLNCAAPPHNCLRLCGGALWLMLFPLFFQKHKEKSSHRVCLLCQQSRQPSPLRGRQSEGRVEKKRRQGFFVSSHCTNSGGGSVFSGTPPSIRLSTPHGCGYLLHLVSPQGCGDDLFSSSSTGYSSFFCYSGN